MKVMKKINPMKAIKFMAKMIVKFFDTMSCIIPTLMLSDWYPERANPIEYGMFALFGLIACACVLFGVLFILVVVCSIFIQYPIASVSVVLVLATFVGIGFIRKKIGRRV